MKVRSLLNPPYKVANFRILLVHANIALVVIITASWGLIHSKQSDKYAL